MRIGLVSHWYDPEPGGAAMPGIHARALAELGHEVHVLTGFPNYPTGKVFPGYKVRPYLRQETDGITIHRAPLYPSHDTSALHRIANYMSLAAAASVVGPMRLPALDAVLVHSTPATIAVPALALQATRGTPFVLHIQDLWPQSVTSSGFTSTPAAKTMAGIIHRFTDLTYRRASAVAVTSPGMAKLIRARGIPGEALEFVPNWADEAAFHPVSKNVQLAAELGLNRPFTVMYAGNFGTYQTLDVLIEAAEQLRHEDNIGFALVGGGVIESDLRRRVANGGLDNVTFLPPQPFSRMAEVLALADVQYVGLQDLPLFRSTLPSKMQANMAAGRPILGALTGDAAEVVRSSGAGVVVRPGDPENLTSAIRELANIPPAALAALGARAREHYEAQFSKEVNVRRLEVLLANAADAGRGRNRHVGRRVRTT